MVLHGVSHDIGHLGEAPVVGLLHRMEDAALHGLQAIVDVGYGTVQYHIAGIVYPVILEHAVERHSGALFLHISILVFFHKKIQPLTFLPHKRL